jgi:glyceraldehyde-3-phosphate dehydrogenase/erythrose-4-phosphate dehydrogenase
VDAYEKAQAAAPNFAIVHTNLAIALTEMGTQLKMAGVLLRLSVPTQTMTVARISCNEALTDGLLKSVLMPIAPSPSVLSWLREL